MLQIRVNNQFLDLGKVSITFEMLSPIFNDIGSFSYPFSLPATARNKHLLGHPQRINLNNAAPYKNPAQILWNGIVYKNGLLITKETSPDFIKAYIAADEGYFYNAIKDIKLNEIDMGGERNQAQYNGPGANDVWSNAYESLYPDADFTLFYHINNLFWDGYDIPLPYSFGGFYDINYYHAFDKMNRPRNLFVPFPYLNYVIDSVLKELGIIEKYNVLKSHEELKQLVLYNMTSTNVFTQEGDVITFPQKETFNLKNHVPAATISELFKAIENTFQLFAFFSDSENAVKLLLFKDILNSDPVELPHYLKITDLEPNEYDGYEAVIDVEAVSEYTKNIDPTNFNYRGAVNNLNDLPASGNEIDDVFLIEDIMIFRYWNWRKNIATGQMEQAWLNFPHRFFGGKEGAGKLKITVPGSMKNMASSLKGNIGEDPREEINDCPVSFAFFRGMLNYNLVNQPIGNSEAISGDDYNFNLSLYWHGQTGLYENFWKLPIEFHRTTRQAEFEIPFTAAELKNLDFSKKYRFAGADWLLSKINFTMTNNRITPAKVVAWKV